jgi:hypothetical protein
MTSTWFRRLWLITCLTLLGGLATAVPVNCVCDADQHWGQAVHPLFQHYHGDGHSHAAAEKQAGPLASTTESSGPAFVVSEHGSLLGVAVDAILFGRANLWLTLGLLPLLTLIHSARGGISATCPAPPTGPPRLRALFS